MKPNFDGETLGNKQTRQKSVSCSFPEANKAAQKEKHFNTAASMGSKWCWSINHTGNGIHHRKTQQNPGFVR